MVSRSLNGAATTSFHPITKFFSILVFCNICPVNGVHHKKVCSLKLLLNFVSYIRSAIAANMWYGKTVNRSCVDLKEVYGAPSREAAEQALERFDKTWGSKYKHAVQSWRTNWDQLTSYFDFPLEIRKMIYTTNSIENVNRGIRKYTKAKVQFPDDMSAQKAVYMAIMNIEKKWTMALHNWGLVMHQFVTIFENRCRL